LEGTAVVSEASASTGPGKGFLPDQPGFPRAGFSDPPSSFFSSTRQAPTSSTSPALLRLSFSPQETPAFGSVASARSPWRSQAPVQMGPSAPFPLVLR